MKPVFFFCEVYTEGKLLLPQAKGVNIRHKAMWEVIRIANKLGIDIGQNEIDRQEHTLGRLPYENKPSTLQDLEVGKRTEVDMFAGTVVRLGKELGVETPVCECFLHGIHLIEARMFKEI